MINIIFPIDPSTKFLYKIVENILKDGVECNIIEVYPSEKSYVTGKSLVTNLQNNWDVLFLGHGQSNQIYGGESEEFEKRAFITNKEMTIFKSRNLFALACDSSILLKETFLHSGIIKSIGFGALPTEKAEVENDNRLKEAGIDQSVIDLFKEVIVNTVSKALSSYILEKKDYVYLFNYLTLLLNKEINDSVLVNSNRILADLIFKMRKEMKLY